ncbi:Alpha-1,2-mannosyltransferase MNN2 [Cytospora mali]|uniref:Alpha-1,2-mannosyltransferase MNN2 n=1 Tax=Cytospora mali TaxID=578113 RepID=A0A194US62_CYTMA|nr:Alpha-1,2-mannosyltransferase MNN2 [Valsa mali var. pyri (nom. inval.)]
MRLTRRLLSVVALFGLIIVLIRYRQSVEATIEEAIGDGHSEILPPGEDANSPKNRQLPLVILPFVKTEEEKKAAIAAAVEEKADTADNAASGSKSNSFTFTDSDGKKVDAQPFTPPPDGGKKDGNAVTDTGVDEITDVGTFWAKWSRDIYATRPTIPKISLSGHAQTQRPREGQTTREPHHDHVRNSEDDIDALRRLHEEFVEQLEKELGNSSSRGQSERQWNGSNIFKGKGIVIVGGGEYFGPAITSIQMLRRTGNGLPVEVFVPDDDEYEKAVCEDYLKKLDAKCVVLSHILNKSTVKVSQKDDADLKVTHYQLKSLSVLLSSFEDVLLLDSDSIPLLDPLTNIFWTEPYRSKGMIIWPDFWRATESPMFWTVAGKSSFPTGLPVTSSETGQMVINKTTHLAPLLLATYYNIFGPDYYYPLLSQGALGQGDKETFFAAALALNSSYYRVQTPAGLLGRHDGRTEKGTALVQHLPLDDMEYTSAASIRPAFVHSNTPKMNAGHLIDEGDLLAADGVTRLRLLGSKQESLNRFGFDVERAIWDLMVQTGCELQDVLREWKGRKGMCEKLEEHYKLVFGIREAGGISGSPATGEDKSH